jgi:predicted anti-sigma-YlaC factor YlaD
MQHGTYSCKDLTKMLSGYIDEECSPEDKALIEAHLADCPNCIAFVNTFRKSISLAKDLVYEDIPEDLARKLPRPFWNPKKGWRTENGFRSPHPVVFPLPPGGSGLYRCRVG